MNGETLLKAIVFFGICAAGIFAGDSFRRRAKLSAELLRETGLLKDRLISARLPLSEAVRGMRLFGNLAQQIEAVGAPEAWRRYANGAEILSSMGREERDTMDRLWSDLGLLIMDEQKRRFEMAEKELAVIRDQAAEAADQRFRLCVSLGILAGLAALILMW